MPLFADEPNSVQYLPVTFQAATLFAANVPLLLSYTVENVPPK